MPQLLHKLLSPLVGSCIGAACPCDYQGHAEGGCCTDSLAATDHPAEAHGGIFELADCEYLLGFRQLLRESSQGRWTA